VDDLIAAIFISNQRKVDITNMIPAKFGFNWFISFRRDDPKSEMSMMTNVN